nr:ATP-citrate synthase alpha chain protein 2 [Ipomoea batatas]
MVSELAGEEAMMPQLPALARRLLKIAELRPHSLPHFFQFAEEFQCRREDPEEACWSWCRHRQWRSMKNSSKRLVNSFFAVFNRSRSVKMSSRVLIDVVFEVFDRDSWSRSSESLSTALVPLCVVILVNMTASEGSIATMCDRFLEEEFPENDQLEGLEKSNFNSDLNASKQENDDDLFADVSFRNSNDKEHESDIFSGKSTTTDLKRRFFESDAFGIGRFSRGRPPLESITTQFPSILRLECDVQIGSMDRRTVLLRFATKDECKRTWIRGQAEVDGVHFLSSAMVALRILDLVVLSLSLSCGAVGVRCRWHGVGDMARKKIREYDSKRLLKEHLKHLYGIDL